MPDPDDALALARWRLVLGRFSDRCLGGCPFPGNLGRGSGQAQGPGEGRPGSGGPGNYERMERALDHLYGREYAGRGVRGKERARDGDDDDDFDDDDRTGGTGDSVLAIPGWLHDVRELFPRETVEVIERHALDRYGMTELVTDETVLKSLEPSYELLKAVLAFRHLMSPKVLEVARGVVRQVVEELRRRLTREVRPVLWGRLNRQRRTRLKVASNLDFRRTIRANLRHYDLEKRRLLVQSLHFFARVEHHLPWHIIMAVDCSGSMTDSVIHSAVMAGIFRALPAVRVSLVAFDTAVIDLTEQADDPVAVLMGVQLGGGTDIAGALGYCETLIRTPTRTIVVVVTDFFEGGPPDHLVAAVKRMREAGARVLGLAALDAGADPVYDHAMAERCAAAGAEVAALTPRRLAEWMARVLLTALRAALASFDDDALAALASKGLVRRARNDLAATPPTVLGPEGDRLRVSVGDATALPALPPSQSSCTCPAAGICRHVLAALLFVRESAPGVDAAEAEPAPSAVAEILSINDESLTKWAGKALVARASRSLAFGPAAEIEEAGAVVVRFPARNVTCRWMSGGGLAGMLCSCHAPAPCEHRVAAVLAVQAARGARDLAATATAMEPPADAPRTRDEVRASLASVLAGLVTSGTSRLSRATGDRLRTLAVSAHGVDLPRLERLVRTLADEVELTLARHAQADAARLLAAAARADVLNVALARPTPALVGTHRSHYEPVGAIELVGLGARAWRARSGYAGLTVYFWDRTARTWSTWTDARPTSTTTGGFDPRTRYLTGGPWSGLPNPSHASRHVLRLTGAYRNHSGRLSGRPSTEALDTGPSDPSEAPAVTCWSELVGRAALLFDGGFGDRTEGDPLVRLVPASWQPASFDPVRQEAVRPVTDADGRALPLVLADTPENRPAVSALESFSASPGDSLLGVLKLDSGRLCVEPVALYTRSKVVSLTLDTLPSRSVRHPPVFPPADDPDGDDPDGADPDALPSLSSTRLGAFLSRLAVLLESLGEGGFASFRDLDELRTLAARADALGLSSCALPAARVVAHLERLRLGVLDDPDRPARDLLRAYHVARLALAHESISAATAGLGAITHGLR